MSAFNGLLGIIVRDLAQATVDEAAGAEELRAGLLPMVDRLSALCHGDDCTGLPRGMVRMARMALRSAAELCEDGPEDAATMQIMREQATLVYLRAAAECAAVAAREVGGVEPAVLMLAGASATTALLRRDAEPYKQVAMIVSQTLVEAYKGDGPVTPEAFATALGHGLALAVGIAGVMDAQTQAAGRARLAALLRTLVMGAQAVLAADAEDAKADAAEQEAGGAVRSDN